MNYKLSNDDALCISDVMVELCKLELASRNELREKTGYAKVNPQEKKICNCPNCGAPISSYICEYCGTEFEKPKKVLTDEEKRESFVEFARKQQLNQIQASQEWQKQQILNTLNTYSVQTQIANIRDSVNAHTIQTCSLQDSMKAYQSQISISPYQGPKVKEKPKEEKKAKTADEELAEALIFCMIGMVLFTLFVIVVTFIYNLH